jgi:hypothetical protein
MTKNGEEKSAHLMKKAIIRLMIYKDNDLRLLPIYFNRLRQHKNIR